MKSPLPLTPLLATLLLSACGGGGGDDSTPTETSQLTPDQIITDHRLDLLHDEVYQFPAYDEASGTVVMQPLQRWDFIFAGAAAGQEDNINHIIPGSYDHAMVYLGKDDNGFAYLVEVDLNGLQDLEGIRMVSPGRDYGVDPHSSAGFRIEGQTRRWAKRLVASELSRVQAQEPALLAQLQEHLDQHLPYQFEVTFSANPLTDKRVTLVDDGFEGGANCADYWTTLLEQYAQVCFYDVRMGADELTSYLLNDPEGQLAYVPEEFLPIPWPNPIYGSDLIQLGYTIVEDEPHTFVCGGEAESGLVIPQRLMESPLFSDIPAE